MDASWTRIETWLKVHAPVVYAGLNEPATEGAAAPHPRRTLGDRWATRAVLVLNYLEL